MESGCSRAFNISELPQSTTVSCTQANSDSAHAAVCKWQHGTAQPMATASTSMYGLDHSWAVGKCQHGVHESMKTTNTSSRRDVKLFKISHILQLDVQGSWNWSNINKMLISSTASWGCFQVTPITGGDWLVLNQSNLQPNPRSLTKA